MKITMVNTNAVSGGAAKAVYRLHKGLTDLGHESLFYTTQKNNNDNTVQQFRLPQNLDKKFKRYARQQYILRRIKPYRNTRASGHELFSDCQSRYGKTVIEQMPGSDVINLHWIADFTDIPSFFASVPQHKPIVWTLHDMNPFTGGCHYDDGCGRYTQNCGACPQLGSQKNNDLSYKIWKQKMATFSQLDPERFHVVTPSKWLAKEVSRSTLLKRFCTTVIPNGLDTDVFTPRDTSELKQTLNIPADAHIILFVADSIENKRKGLHFLLDAISSMKNHYNIVLLSVGKGYGKIATSFLHIHIGQIDDERILSMIYSLADVFVLPSLQDNLPNSAIESLACGTPVVGFDIGGIPDIIKNGKTGFLVPARGNNEMKEAIEEILNNNMLRNTMSQYCRTEAVKKYNVLVQAKKYYNLYNLLLQTSPTAQND